MSYPDQLPPAVQTLVDRETTLREQYARAQEVTHTKRREANEAPRRYDQQVREAIAAGTDTGKIKRPDIDALQQEVAACARAEADLKRELTQIRYEIGETVAAHWDEAISLMDPIVEGATQRLADLEAQVEQARADLRRHLMARAWLSQHQYPRTGTGAIFGAQQRPGWGRSWQPTPESLQELRTAEAKIAALWANQQRGRQQAEIRRADLEKQQAAADAKRKERREARAARLR